MTRLVLETLTVLMLLESSSVPSGGSQLGGDGLLHFTYHARVTNTIGPTDPIKVGDPLVIKMTVDPNFDYGAEQTLSGGLFFDVFVDGIDIYLNGENSGLRVNNGSNGTADSILLYTEGGARSTLPDWNGGDLFHMSLQFTDPSGTALSANETWPTNYDRRSWRDIDLFVGNTFTGESEFTARVPENGGGLRFLAISCLALVGLSRVHGRKQFSEAGSASSFDLQEHLQLFLLAAASARIGCHDVTD